VAKRGANQTSGVHGSPGPPLESPLFITAKTVCANVSLNARSRAQVCAWNSAHPGLPNRKKQGSKIHSPLEQRRSELQNPSVALSECLVNYEFSSPVGVCAPGMAQTQCRENKNKPGSKIHSALEQLSSQLQKQFSQMSLRIREQSSTYICSWASEGFLPAGGQ